MGSLAAGAAGNSDMSGLLERPGFMESAARSARPSPIIPSPSSQANSVHFLNARLVQITAHGILPAMNAANLLPPDEALSPAERRRQQVRRAILDAAERVFAAEGEAGLSIRRLAEEIDYSPAAIYKYFDSKAALVEELKQAFFERFIVRLARVLASGDDFMTCAVNGCIAYIETAIERPHHYVAAFSGQTPAEMSPGASPERHEAFMTSPAGRAFASLRDMVAEGVRDGHFARDLDPLMAAKSVWASCHGLAMLIAHLPHFPAMEPGRQEHTQTAFIAHHARTLVAGLRAS
jgi:AcrR family transcriptional regulator